MGGMKSLTGGHHACQEAAWWGKQRDKCDSVTSRAGSSPAWDLLLWLLSRKGRTGPEQGHRMSWQGHGDRDELQLGWAGGQGQEWRSRRLRDTCHPAPARPRARAAAPKQARVETARALPLSATCTQLCCMAAWLHGCRLHACMDAWLHQAGPQPTTSLTNGWVDEARFAHRKALKCYAVPSWGFNHVTRKHSQSKRPDTEAIRRGQTRRIISHIYKIQTQISYHHKKEKYSQWTSVKKRVWHTVQ